MSSFNCYRCGSTDKARHWASFGMIHAICKACDAEQQQKEDAAQAHKEWKALALEMADHPTYQNRLLG